MHVRFAFVVVALVAYDDVQNSFHLTILLIIMKEIEIIYLYLPCLCLLYMIVSFIVVGGVEGTANNNISYCVK
jgi:hypothetical protein